MKKLFFCLAIAIVAIACLFSAGCIGTSGTNELSQEEKEYNEVINIINNQPEHYVVEKYYFDDFTTSNVYSMLLMTVDEYGNYIDHEEMALYYNSWYQISDNIFAFSVEDPKTKEKEIRYFLIEDNTISKNCYITTIDDNPGKPYYIQYPDVLYLKPNDFDRFINLVDKHIEELEK